MDQQIKWHNHFNWTRLLAVFGVLFGMVCIGIGIHNVTGILCANAAIAAANSGADPLTAASAAGPSDTTLNWTITAITAAIGFLSTLLGLLKSWQVTGGLAVVDKLNALQNAPVPPPASGETAEVLLEKLRQVCQNEAADKLSAIAEAARGTK